MSQIPRDPKTGKYNRFALIRSVFTDLSTTEVVKLNEQDRNELASAIARNTGIVAEDCSFEFVDY